MERLPQLITTGEGHLSEKKQPYFRTHSNEGLAINEFLGISSLCFNLDKANFQISGSLRLSRMHRRRKDLALGIL